MLTNFENKIVFITLKILIKNKITNITFNIQTYADITFDLYDSVSVNEFVAMTITLDSYD